MLADGTWFLTKRRVETFDFSFPLLATEQVHMMRKPQLSSLQGMSLIFTAFTKEFYIATIVAVLSALLISRLLFKQPQRTIFVSSGDLEGTSGNRLFAIRHRTLVGILGYFLVVLMGLYQGKLLTQLLFYTVPSEIRSVEELAAELRAGRLKMLTPSLNWALFEKINSSQNYEFQ